KYSKMREKSSAPHPRNPGCWALDINRGLRWQAAYPIWRIRMRVKYTELHKLHCFWIHRLPALQLVHALWLDSLSHQSRAMKLSRIYQAMALSAMGEGK